MLMITNLRYDKIYYSCYNYFFNCFFWEKITDFVEKKFNNKT